MRREGLSAAVLRLKGRWRSKRRRAKLELISSNIFKELEEIAPHLCTSYLSSINIYFNKLRDKELQEVSEYWESTRINETQV